MFNFSIFIKPTTHRYFALIFSVCCVFNSFAQQDFSQRIYDALISQDISECNLLMQQIGKSDIDVMPDSTLFNYYYLAGWHASNTENIEGQIDCLVKAKEICENKLGIHYNVFVYFEILKALGEACEDLHKDDEALLWYEEGLVKGMPYLETADAELSSYFKDIRNNAADIYQKRGHKDMADVLRFDNPLEHPGTFDYACQLLEEAVTLSQEEKGQEAIRLLDEAHVIFNRTGDEGKEMLQPLNRAYLKCYALTGDTCSIDSLFEVQQDLYRGDNQQYWYSDMEEVVATFILVHHDIKTAEKYHRLFLSRLNEQQRHLEMVEQSVHNFQFFKQAYAQIDSLENLRSSVPNLSYQWGIYSLQLSNVLIQIRRNEEANDICLQVYEMSSALKEDPENLHWFVLMNLADYYRLAKKGDQAERFLKEQLDWLDERQIAANAQERGWAYSQLGIVYMNGGQYNQSAAMQQKAEEILLPIYGKVSFEYAIMLHNKGRLAQLQGKYQVAKHLLEESSKIQISIKGKTLDKTTQYLKEVQYQINTSL